MLQNNLYGLISNKVYTASVRVAKMKTVVVKTQQMANESASQVHSFEHS